MIIMYKFEKEAINRFGKNYEIVKSKDYEWRFPCRHCGKFNTNNLYVDVKNGLYNCFHCGYKGRLRSIPSLADLKQQNIMSNDSNISLDDNGELILIPFYPKDLTQDQIKALYNRNITDEDIAYYNISGFKHNDRIQIPNKVVGCLTDFVQRWEWDKNKITKYNPKYLNVSGAKKANTVFNLHNININTDIIVCEGLFNAITAGRNAVATYGCNPSDIQILKIIRKKPKSINIVYDSDKPGIKGSLNFINMLHKFKFNGLVYFTLLPKNIDINDMGRIDFMSYNIKSRITIDINNNLSRRLPYILYNTIK